MLETIGPALLPLAIGAAVACGWYVCGRFIDGPGGGGTGVIDGGTVLKDGITEPYPTRAARGGYAV